MLLEWPPVDQITLPIGGRPCGQRSDRLPPDSVDFLTARRRAMCPIPSPACQCRVRPRLWLTQCRGSVHSSASEATKAGKKRERRKGEEERRKAVVSSDEENENTGGCEAPYLMEAECVILSSPEPYPKYGDVLRADLLQHTAGIVLGNTIPLLHTHVPDHDISKHLISQAQLV